MKSIETFTFDGITLDFFLNYSTMKYDITIFTKQDLTRYVHTGIESIYEAGHLFMRYKLDILRHGHDAILQDV